MKEIKASHWAVILFVTGMVQLVEFLDGLLLNDLNFAISYIPSLVEILILLAPGLLLLIGAFLLHRYSLLQKNLVLQGYQAEGILFVILVTTCYYLLKKSFQHTESFVLDLFFYGGFMGVAIELLVYATAFYASLRISTNWLATKSQLRMELIDKPYIDFLRQVMLFIIHLYLFLALVYFSDYDSVLRVNLTYATPLLVYFLLSHQLKAAHEKAYGEHFSAPLNIPSLIFALMCINVLMFAAVELGSFIWSLTRLEPLGELMETTAIALYLLWIVKVALAHQVLLSLFQRKNIYKL